MKPCYLILALLCAGGTLLCACDNNSSTEDTSAIGTGTAANETASSEQTADTTPKDNLPNDLDFNGQEVTIHARGDYDSYLEICAEDNAEVLDDAIYKRNRTVEERLNVTLVPYRANGWASYDQDITKLRASISAGDDEYQLIAGWNVRAASLAMEGCFWDLNDVRYLDTAMPWWNKRIVDTLQICNSMYFVTGDISVLTNLGGSYVLFLNNVIAKNHNIPSLADVVREGNWTIDYMISVIKDISGDLDGNGVMDTKDYYGLVLDFYNSADSFYVSGDNHQITTDADGVLHYKQDTDRINTLMEKIYPLYYEVPYSMSEKEPDIQVEMFRNGQAMLINRELDAARIEFRNMEDDYTILPFPKLDDAQKTYITNSSNGATIWGIPTSNPNPDMAAAVMEAMASENYRTVTPVYFETCMQDKYARNDDTIEMLGIIRDTSYMDAELLYNSILGDTDNIVRDLLVKKSKNAASWLASNEKRVKAAVDKVMAAFEKLK